MHAVQRSNSPPGGTSSVSSVRTKQRIGLSIGIKEQLIKIARQNSGAFTLQNVRNADISIRTFYRMRDAGEVICISRGVYQLADNYEGSQGSPEYAIIKARIPQSVLCLVSALYHHELTVEIPRCVHIAIKRNSPIPRINYPKLRIYRMSEKSYNSGIDQQLIDGVSLNIYSPEKTIADCFKYRNQLGTYLAVEALKKYLSRKNAKPSTVLKMAEEINRRILPE